MASLALGWSSTGLLTLYIVASEPRAAELARSLAHEHPEDDVTAGPAVLYGRVNLDTDTVSTGGVETLLAWGYHGEAGDGCGYLYPPVY